MKNLEYKGYTGSIEYSRKVPLRRSPLKEASPEGLAFSYFTPERAAIFSKMSVFS